MGGGHLWRFVGGVSSTSQSIPKNSEGNAVMSGEIRERYGRRSASLNRKCERGGRSGSDQGAPALDRRPSLLVPINRDLYTLLESKRSF